MTGAGAPVDVDHEEAGDHDRTVHAEELLEARRVLHEAGIEAELLEPGDLLWFNSYAPHYSDTNTTGTPPDVSHNSVSSPRCCIMVRSRAALRWSAGASPWIFGNATSLRNSVTMAARQP